MDSNYLKKRGFEEFGQLKHRSFIDDARNKKTLCQRGVYALVFGRKFNRLSGKTDILYIGQAGGNHGNNTIYKRISNYCVNNPVTNQDKRIHDALINIEEILKKKVFLFFKVLEQRRCGVEEAKLIGKFEEEHLELTPLNSSRPKRK